MKVLVVGSGGREHALVWAFSQSSAVTEIFCANGNAGIGELATCVDIRPEEIERLADFADSNDIDLTFVGGESALALGITDEFERRGLKIIGVSRKAAQLEASKSFAKDFMQRHEIPTAAYAVANSAAEAISILESGRFGGSDIPVVVKADGLAAGKGVVVAQNRVEAIAAVEELTSGDTISREAAQRILIEECLVGREVSVLLFTDGENFALMPPARDHKRIGEGDTGPNTGGMGVITDQSLLSNDQLEEIVKNIVEPTLNGAAEEGFPIRGILFLGLMLTADGPRVLEYNVRFGDPETEAILVRLKTDIVDICNAISDGRLDKLNIEWLNGSSACVVLASSGYPAKPKVGDIIHCLNEARNSTNTQIFHAGTKKSETGEFVTSGGRVLAVTSTGADLEEALQNAYCEVEKIKFDGMQYRRDIGQQIEKKQGA